MPFRGAISMAPTDGMVRGAEVRDTGSAITVPVGEISDSAKRLLKVTEESLELAIDKLVNSEQWTGDQSKTGPFGTTCLDRSC